MSLRNKNKDKLVGMVLRLRKDLESKENSIQNHIKVLDEYRSKITELECKYEYWYQQAHNWKQIYLKMKDLYESAKNMSTKNNKNYYEKR